MKLPDTALSDITLLGGFLVRLPSGAAVSLPTKKAQALLAYLAVPAGLAHPRDKLASLLWGDMQEPQARASLRQAIFAIRKALPPTDLLSQEGGSVALRSDAVQVDVARFERLVTDGKREALERAVGLYRGAFLDGLATREAPFEEWLITERLRLQELMVEALARLLSLQRGAGDLEAAVHSAHRLLAIDPAQEPVHRVLMRLLVQLGRRGTALRQYQACVEALARELRIEPDPETKALYQEILATRSANPLKDEALAPGPIPGQPTARGFEPHGHQPPLVGREAELARLQKLLDQTWARQGPVVALTGETGIGKSRLAGELLTEAEKRGGRTLVGQCYETEQILPFGPWVDALRTLPADVLSNALEALRPAWRIELARLLPELGADPPGPDASPGALRLFDAVTQLLLQGLAARQPLVILIEDLQWADEMSIRLLAFLGRRVQRAPVAVIVTVRDEDAAETPLLRQTLDELTLGRQAVPLALGALSREDTSTLVRHLARPEEGSPLEDQVWRASEGNPFMIVETLRVVDTGAAVDRPIGLPLPERIRDVVAHRLERLSERSRRLVAVAAVIGRQFDFSLLHRAGGVTEGEASEGVEELVRQRILHGVGEELEFTHDRVREIATKQLLPAVRKGLHRRVAEALQDLHARDVAPHALTIATHYLRAEVWDQAAGFFRQAGDTAFARTGRREAVTCYEQALVAAAAMPVDRASQQLTCDLHFTVARTLYWTGDFASARAQFREAEAVAQALGDDRRQAHILGGLGYLLGSEGEHAGAAEAGDLALAIARSLGDTTLQVWTSVALGREQFALGAYPLAIEQLRSTLEILRTRTVDWKLGPGSLLPAVGARTWLALCLSQLGQFPEAITWGEEASRIAEAVDSAQERVWAFYCLGQILLLRGEADRGQPLLESAVGLCEDGRFPIYAPRALASLGVAYARRGRFDEALVILERAAAETSAINLRYGQAMVLAMLAHAYLTAGRPDRAGDLAREALAIARARGERGDEAWALHLIGSLPPPHTPLDAAEAILVESLALACTLGMRPLEARGRLALGRLHLSTGRIREARGDLARAAEDLRTMGMMLWVAEAETLLAAREVMSGRDFFGKLVLRVP
ncbi:MAG: ATP-binding protein [Candidatus Rokuibacteriota bacterium]